MNPISIELTPTEMDIFNDLVKAQFQYGGTRYAGSTGNPQREATDDLFDDFGECWLLGTVAKYVKRFSNLPRERDLLKIACYMYIIWLKRGFHLNPQGTLEVIDTNVKIKEQFFLMFTGAIDAYSEVESGIYITSVYSQMEECAKKGFSNIKEEDLFFVYKTTYSIWKKKFESVAGEDADVYNEEK